MWESDYVQEGEPDIHLLLFCMPTFMGVLGRCVASLCMLRRLLRQMLYILYRVQSENPCGELMLYDAAVRNLHVVLHRS
jgi:hypothetical protein